MIPPGTAAFEQDRATYLSPATLWRPFGVEAKVTDQVNPAGAPLRPFASITSSQGPGVRSTGIHHEDFVAAVRWLIDHDDIDGVVNISSPNPLPNAEFMRLLRQACGVSFGLPARAWMLEIGAVFMRTETELILKSRRVTPGRLLEYGFNFKFPYWNEAARDLFHQWKMMRAATPRAA